MKDHKKPNIIILGINNFTYDEFMEIFYSLIISSPKDVLEYDETVEHKIEKLDTLLKFFEDREEFEKCAKIKEMKNLIISTKNE